MPYSNRIKTLEESYRLLGEQIKILESSKNYDMDKMKNLIQNKNMCLEQLRDLRKLQYNYTQIVDFGDDR